MKGLILLIIHKIISIILVPNILFSIAVNTKKYMNIITFKDVNGNYGNKELYLTVNRDDMNNPEYGTKENPVPVLKAVGVSEPIWFSGKDTDSVFIDKFYRNNVINYLKYKLPKEEFERRFKSKE